MISNDVQLTRLGTLRGRLSTGHAERMDRSCDVAWMTKATERWNRLRMEYERELADFIAGADAPLVVEMRDELVARLTRGFGLPETPETVEAIEILLGRYMAAQDSVDGILVARMRLAMDERQVTRAMLRPTVEVA